MKTPNSKIKRKNAEQRIGLRAIILFSFKFGCPFTSVPTQLPQYFPVPNPLALRRGYLPQALLSGHRNENLLRGCWSASKFLFRNLRHAELDGAINRGQVQLPNEACAAVLLDGQGAVLVRVALTSCHCSDEHWAFWSPDDQPGRLVGGRQRGRVIARR